ncbi:MAG TPA: hypothetical protein PK156_47195 [Polyangium sp.]|nr:hypothetical protein [Polyangium sp.]
MEQEEQDALLEIAARIESLLRGEIARPGLVFAPLHQKASRASAIIREPDEDELARIIFAACVALGRVIAEYDLDENALISLVDVSCAKGVAPALASIRKPDRSLVTRVENLEELLSFEAVCPGTVPLYEHARGAVTPALEVARASALAVGSLVHDHELPNVSDLVRQTHQGVLAGRTAREKEA